jgi:hypothetical protein
VLSGSIRLVSTRLSPLTGRSDRHGRAPVHTGLRRLRRRERKTSPAPTTMTAPPAAASVPLVPGPVPPPVAGAPAGALVVATGVACVVVSVGAPVGVLGVVAVPVGVAVLVGVAVPARVAGQIGVAAAVLVGVAVEVAGVHTSQCGCCPPSGSHAIGVPFAATPDMFRSALGQNSPAL